MSEPVIELEDGPRREVTAAIARPVVDYVARTLGDAGVAALEAASGIDVASVVRDRGSWLSNTEMLGLARAAAVLCGDDDIGRRAGEELFWSGCEGGMAGIIVGLGSILEAVRALVAHGTKMSTGRTLTFVEAGDSHASFEGAFVDPSVADPFYCGFARGYYTLLPSLFGAVGRVIEKTCQLRGADRCRFELSWTADPRPRRAASEDDVAAMADKSEQILVRFEQLQEMAAQLVRAEDVEEVLARICERASLALDAPRFLLAVETGGRRRVHQVGFTNKAELDAATSALLDADLGAQDGVLVADVASSRRRYGRLAAHFVHAAEFAAYEHRLLEAYAGHAAAALDVVSSLEEARRERDAARGLLVLASELANVNDRGEIADRLAASVPLVVRSNIATVWGWHETKERLDCIAWHDVTGVDPTATIAALPPMGTAEMPSLADYVRNPRPLLVRLQHTPGVLQQVLVDHDVETVAIVPIVASSHFYGVVTAGFHAIVDELETAEILERLGGLAHHAAAALDNARLLEEIRHQALHDPLTGLPNRRLIQERAAKVLADTDVATSSAALLFIDLDRFKNVNDTLGHRAGDDLIGQVADRIRSALRPAQMLGRLGGDEFLVILPELSRPEDAEAVAGAVVDVLDAPFVLEGEELFVSCSIGIACFPAHGGDLASLMRHADSAMYTAKARGRRTFAVDPTGPEPHRRQQLTLETGLHKAIANDELWVAYQPQVDIASGRVLGVEALVRWEHPTLGQLAPAAFLPLAEESGLIVELDRHVRRVAFENGARWAASGSPLSVAVNLSTRDLQDPHLARELAAMIHDAGIDPGLVELEVTDLVVMGEAVLAPILRELKQLGVRLAIDDFGTGNSVLGRLHHCPLDTLKIDKSFIDAAGGFGSEVPLVRALIALAHSLELTVVAEGVERPAQLALLRRYGCDVGQGYLFGRPMTAGAIDGLLADGAARQPVASVAAR